MDDLSKQQMFDMNIQLKCLSLLLPEDGFYKPLSIFISSIIFIEFDCSDCQLVVHRFNSLQLKSILNDQNEDDLFRVINHFH